MSTPQPGAVNALVSGGYSPLSAMVLAARGLDTPEKAKAYHSCACSLLDPYLMTDMARAVGRVGQAMREHEKIAVFGDYDVDGITATCLLTDFLRKNGADVISYIPGRLEEGYGLNMMAIRQLYDEGVKLIITVDCGITAITEAHRCKELGIDLVITDHHECKEMLPEAVAVVDPHRPDGGYPHTNLSGVAVAFKLACALSGDQEEILNQYADMVCLGTVADVIPLLGENRVFVSRGLKMLQNTQRKGLQALMRECACDPASISASTIGYNLAPRINAAGRMGRIQLAIDLFLTDDEQVAADCAKGLCELNRQRQQIESEIYAEARGMLPGNAPEAIVLAGETWHQGVVGIVASRIAEEYACPTFLICLDGEHGKASSRSHGGFNLFSSLRTLSPLLESYGGHELAAGFTITRSNIEAFRREVTELARAYFEVGMPRTVLDADCIIGPEMMTVPNVESLSILEPCGSGCPKPILVMEHMTVERITMVGNGKHMRLRLRAKRESFGAIYFSATPESASISQGDVVDVAFYPQINDFRGERTVQINVVDIRPSCSAPCSCDTADYTALREDRLSAEAAAALLPPRSTLAMVWRYLSGCGGDTIAENPMCLCRKIVRWSGSPLSLGQMLTCLDIFTDVGLMQQHKEHKYITITLTPGSTKADLSASKTMQILVQKTKM